MGTSVYRYLRAREGAWVRGGVEEGEVGGLQLLLKDEDVDDNVEEDAKDAGVVPVVTSHRGDGGCETRGAGKRGEGRGERGEGRRERGEGRGERGEGRGERGEGLTWQ
jgi:hypothetical protein